MNTKRFFVNILGFTFSILLCFFITTNIQAKSSDDKKLDEKIKSLDKLTKTLAIVEQYYVDDENITDLIDKSIAGLLSNLDAHSSFLNEKDFQTMKIQTDGEFGGLGITVGMKNNSLTIIAPMEGTPADKAGLKPGDIILKINNNSTLNLSLNDAVDKMRGKPNTKITLTIYRKGSDKPFEVTLKREIIKIDSVYSKFIEKDDILYLRITNFDKNVKENAISAIKKYPKIKGIILDLRNNPGGLLNQAIELTNLFVDNGVIVSQKGRTKAENKTYKADPSKKITNVPVVVLVNSGSASASEIVSGALQDLKRAVIVGENTFGKGSVQSIMPINDKEAIKLTIARYYLPSGRTIQAVGVKPDVEVFPGKVNTSNNEFIVKESDLKKHLEVENQNNQVEPKIQKSNDKNIITQEQINNDIQLKTAIDTIKILNIK